MWLFLFIFFPLLAIAFPSFPTILNWGFLFPFAVVAIGSLTWVALNIFTFSSFSSFAALFACIIFVGLPGGAWVAAKSNE